MNKDKVSVLLRIFAEKINRASEIINEIVKFDETKLKELSKFL